MQPTIGDPANFINLHGFVTPDTFEGYGLDLATNETVTNKWVKQYDIVFINHEYDEKPAQYVRNRIFGTSKPWISRMQGEIDSNDPNRSFDFIRYSEMPASVTIPPELQQEGGERG